jgi:HD-like signal output (HDOD) protein
VLRDLELALTRRGVQDLLPEASADAYTLARVLRLAAERKRLERAARNIASVHTAFLPVETVCSPEPGITVGRRPDALQRVGMREIARLIATATMQGMAPSKLRAYGITGDQYNKSVLFTASASQFIASEVKMDSNMAYLSGLMRPLGILVLNKWAEQQFQHVDKMEWGDAGSLLQWEENSFGINHIEVSSFITRKWGFPAAVSDSIEKSTDQLASITESPMSLILQTAETLAESNRATFHAKQNGAPLRKERLDALGIKSVQLIEISRGALQQSRSFSA